MPFEYQDIKGPVAQRMIDLTVEKGNGVGLSAPQVKINKRFFLAKVDDVWKIFINPTIIEYSSERDTDIEGCLSFPGHYGNVERSKWVKLKYLSGTKMVISIFEGFAARIIQHEYDHLDGVLCIDNMTELTEEQKNSMEE